MDLCRKGWEMQGDSKVEHTQIVLVGPVYPYKGGIAHYTSLLYKALKQRFTVSLLSYKMQYPRILFKKEQKDYSDDMFRVAEAQFYINTANPVNWVKTAGHIRKLKPELVLIEWWHPYFAPCYWTVCKLLGRTKVMFICHNVFPHERFLMDRFLAKKVLGQGDFFIVHSSQDEKDLASIRQDVSYCKTVHPTYNAFKVQNLSKEEARRQLNVSMDVPLLLFFGFVRPYKGLKHLLYAMPQVLKQLREARLMIVGDFAGDKESYLEIIRQEGTAGAVEVYDGYIPDREVEKFFAACDVVVLPYESATQSGIVQIAYGFGKPVIATDVGGLPDVVEQSKTGYIVPPGDADALAGAILQFFREGRAKEFSEAIRREADRYSWERLVSIVAELSGL